VIAAVCTWVQEVLASLNSDECVGVGIAIPGLVQPDTGTILSSTEFNLPPMPLADKLEDRLRARPVLTSRTPAAALAERWQGVARDAENVVYVRLGGYIGGSILIDGLPYFGSGHGSAAIAHLTVDPNGLPCRCGSRGCLDTVGSGAAMARWAREVIKGGRSSALAERAGNDLDLITGEMVVDEAKKGDTVALAALEEAANWLGIAVADCINLLGPDMVVIGGGVGRAAGDLLLEPLRETVRSRAVWTALRGVRIVSTSLGADANACGAAATAILATLTQSMDLHIT
jgi:glucokinase